MYASLTEFPSQQIGFLKYDVAEENLQCKGCSDCRRSVGMRLKVEGLDQGQGNGIHVNVNKEVEKKVEQCADPLIARLQASSSLCLSP
ncbi:hypothetical protein RDI58_015105 [Solanum bulbocastanum]|uniref:Uncharacterized protein n=1 Tax=Solanum bulbocastanum TaxID=147425 RepID=A0AAN8YB66_SOLBU